MAFGLMLVLEGVLPGPPAEAPGPAPARRPPGWRSSGILAPPAGGAGSRETMWLTVTPTIWRASDGTFWMMQVADSWSRRNTAEPSAEMRKR